MWNIRVSTTEDVPTQKELWQLAFGDGQEYMDNFYDTYYRPERVLVLEEEGQVRAMTAWFDTSFVVPGLGEFRAAYLYAVATHPDCRGRGMAAALLKWADEHFAMLNIPAVTTVPAEPSLHNFFGANGFRECFVHGEDQWSEEAPEGYCPCHLLELTPALYGELREILLKERPHIALPVDALEYQAGACALSGGGLYALETPLGLAALCAEGLGDGTLLVKELVADPETEELALEWLPRLLPAWSGRYRVPTGKFPFGMVKWLDHKIEGAWDWATTAYLGLAFD